MGPDMPPDHPTPTRWTASTVHLDMWVDPDDDPRDTGAELTDERSTLLAYLTNYRLTLEMKCAGLDAEQLARRSVPPSTMSLLGLLRHLAEVERGWFRRVLAGQDAPRIYTTEEDRERDWTGAAADPRLVEEAWANWRAEIAFADQHLRAETDLSRRVRTRHGDTPQVRDVLVHLIEEYARHAGHADLLREAIDGRVGQEPGRLTDSGRPQRRISTWSPSPTGCSRPTRCPSNRAEGPQTRAPAKLVPRSPWMCAATSATVAPPGRAIGSPSTSPWWRR